MQGLHARGALGRPGLRSYPDGNVPYSLLPREFRMSTTVFQTESAAAGATQTARAPQAAPSADPDGLPLPRRYAAVAAILGAIVLVVLDSSIANVALPSIAQQLHATPSDTV